MKTYKPIACELVDHIEHIATLKTKVTIVFLRDEEEVKLNECRIKSWENRAGVEWLILEDNLQIRLDELIRINDLDFKNPSCQERN